jgi:hypothetical protein
LFQAINTCNPEEIYKKHWIKNGIPANCIASQSDIVFKYFIYFLTGLSLAGLIASAYERNLYLLVPFSVYLCFGVAHAITYMDLMYYYIKVPFLFIFSGYFINFVQKYKFSLLKYDFSMSYLLCGFLSIWGCYLTGDVLF